ncbi:MAG: helix-turn-helix transcriptional regulator [Lachnospiraceae bacterium]|nr:helix-turn-helix transcriptional regulator [Lachnospiraceae bacterium]
MFPLINKRETGVNLRRIMDMRGITPKDVQEYLGLGCVQSVYRWTDGVNMPTIDNLYALSELLQVPIDAIVRGSRATIVPDIIVKPLDSRERRLCAYYEKLQEKHAA